MSEHHVKAGERDHSKVVVDVVFPSVRESAEVVHPGEEPLHLPASLVAAQRPSILSLPTIAAVGCDHFDAVFVFQSPIQSIGVVGLVTDQPGREFVEEAAAKDLFDKLAFCRRSALDRDGEWKTVTSGDSDDLCALAPARRGKGEAPFWRSRGLHPRTPHPGLVCLARAEAGQAPAALPPVCPLKPIAETAGGRSDTEDTWRASPTTARRGQASTTPRATRSACRATDDHDYPRAGRAKYRLRQLPWFVCQFLTTRHRKSAQTP